MAGGSRGTCPMIKIFHVDFVACRKETILLGNVKIERVYKMNGSADCISGYCVGPPDRSIFIYDPNTQTNHVMNKGVGI